MFSLFNFLFIFPEGVSWPHLPLYADAYAGTGSNGCKGCGKGGDGAEIPSQCRPLPGGQEISINSSGTSSKCEQCPVDSWRRRLNADLLCLLLTAAECVWTSVDQRHWHLPPAQVHLLHLGANSQTILGQFSMLWLCWLSIWILLKQETVSGSGIS